MFLVEYRKFANHRVFNLYYSSQRTISWLHRKHAACIAAHAASTGMVDSGDIGTDMHQHRAASLFSATAGRDTTHARLAWLAGWLEVRK